MLRSRKMGFAASGAQDFKLSRGRTLPKPVLAYTIKKSVPDSRTPPPYLFLNLRSRSSYCLCCASFCVEIFSRKYQISFERSFDLDLKTETTSFYCFTPEGIITLIERQIRYWFSIWLKFTLGNGDEVG